MQKAGIFLYIYRELEISTEYLDTLKRLENLEILENLDTYKPYMI